MVKNTTQSEMETGIMAGKFTSHNAMGREQVLERSETKNKQPKKLSKGQVDAKIGKVMRAKGMIR